MFQIRWFLLHAAFIALKRPYDLNVVEGLVKSEVIDKMNKLANPKIKQLSNHDISPNSARNYHITSVHVPNWLGRLVDHQRLVVRGLKLYGGQVIPNE